MATGVTDTQESDPALIARIRAGDQTALASLYDRHRGVVFALALRVLRDRAEAEEVLTDVFVQAWRGAAAFDAGRGSVPAWLVTLCRSRSIDRLRSRGRREAAVSAHTPEEIDRMAPASEDSASARFESLARRRRIVRALSALTAPQRSALELAYYEGLSHSEIAARLSEPLGTIKTRIRQALIALRESLDAPDAM